MVSIGTGGEKSSNSLQYVHARLQRRTGMICASSGCSVSVKARAILMAPRRLRCTALMRRRKVVRLVGMNTSIYYNINSGLPESKRSIQGISAVERRIGLLNELPL